jgi:hypothetical protein
MTKKIICWKFLAPEITLAKYDFGTSHFGKMNLWPVEHFLLGAIAITPKSENKYVEKVFNWSEVHVSEMTCYKIHTLGYALFLLPGILNIRYNTIGLSVQTAFFGDLNYPRIPFFVHIINKNTWYTIWISVTFTY